MNNRLKRCQPEQPFLPGQQHFDANVKTFSKKSEHFDYDNSFVDLF
jgi:hypothetical protein